jgi:peptide/nickel transport system ATP-binding protein
MTPQTVLRIHDLHVRFAGREDEAVSGVSLDVSAGEVVALVGESGSGKSVTSLAAMGLLPGTASATGSIRVADRDGDREVLGATPSELDDIRGRVVSMVFQEPMTALNPTMTLGAQIAEAVRNHTSATKAEAAERAVELMRQVGIPDAERRANQFPHEFSGGQRQRVVIAIALACEPRVIIADEPTTALDVTVQAEILDLLRALVRERGVGVMMITHNMGVVADLADRVFVMRHGRVVESGAAERVLTAPTHDYTRTLLAAIPELPPAAFGGAEVAGESHAFPAPENPVISMRGVTAGYRVNGRFAPAIHDIDLAVGPGEFVGLVGESGSGKSTVSRLALGLLPASAGEIALLGQPLGALRGRSARRMGESIAEPLSIHARRMSHAEKRARVAELLDAVRLPKDAAARYPHEFSGGQRQRVGLARALVLKPRLLVADEPTSALDVSVQAEVLDVLRALHAELGFGCLFVSHDLGVVNQLTQRVVVMRRGRIVEQGLTADVLRAPRELYTQELLASVPSPDPVAQRERRAARAGLQEK